MLQLAKLQSLAVYFDTDSQTMTGLPTAESNKQFHSVVTIPSYRWSFASDSVLSRYVMMNQKINTSISWSQFQGKAEYKEAFSMMYFMRSDQPSRSSWITKLIDKHLDSIFSSSLKRSVLFSMIINIGMPFPLSICIMCICENDKWVHCSAVPNCATCSF